MSRAYQIIRNIYIYVYIFRIILYALDVRVFLQTDVLENMAGECFCIIPGPNLVTHIPNPANLPCQINGKLLVLFEKIIKF